jgi:predicted dienelactone hydrolase
MKKLLLPILFLTAACASNAPQQPLQPAIPTQPIRYSSEGGSSPVGVIPSAVLHDAARNKDVTVNIEYPTRGAGPFPLIIFSHGYGSSSAGYEGLASYWASYGYIVARPSHADAGALRDMMRERVEQRRQDRNAPRRDRKQMQDERARLEETSNVAETVWANQREPQWLDRARDVSFVIDSLPEIERRFPELAGKIDHAKIGVGGHSYGAFTSMLIAGARTSGASAVSAPDPRVRAVVAMSPQGVGGPQNLTAESFRDMRGPVMFMTGSRDTGAQNETADWRRTSFENAPAGDKYLVFIEGARHMSFAGAMTLNPDLLQRDYDMPPGTLRDPYRDPSMMQQPTNGERGVYRGDRTIFNTVRMASLTFWDAYLKDDAKAKDALHSNVQMFGGTTVTRK